MQLFIDLALGSLLIVVIYAAFRLDRKLAILRADQSEIAQLVQSLDQVTTTARLAVSELRATADKSEQALRSERKRAEALSDELTLIVEAGDNLADRLVDRATASRDAKAAGPDGDDEIVRNILFEADDAVLDPLRAVR